MIILKRTCFALLWAVAANCADQGSVTGRILTAAGAGAAVPNAAVEAKNLKTQAIHMATSAADGRYELNGLPPGAYDISVENVSLFLAFHQRGVQVVAGRSTQLDIRLDDFNLNTLGDGGEQFAQYLADRPAPSGPTPRAATGKPDLSGVWLPTGPSRGAERPELLPSAEAIVKERNAGHGGLPPSGRCLPLGISVQGVFAEYQIVQTATLMAIIDGGAGDPTRLIYLDGRGHPKEFNPSWMGHSTAHWEGDSLVVETAGFNELGWLQGLANIPQTEKLVITERFRRPDLGHLEVETIYEDSGTFKKPFRTRRVNSLAPKDWEILEYVCAENNRDLPHLVPR